MKVAMIGGTGHFGYVFDGLQNHPEIEIVAAAPGSEDENIENVFRMANNLGQQPVKLDDYKKMLDHHKPDIAVIACHFNRHADAVVEALHRGMNVFVEKPIATTLEDLEWVKQAYVQSGVHLAAMFGTRYEPWFLTAKKLIDEQMIGDIRLMNAQKSYRLGQRAPTFRKRETYGGTIPWVGSHAIDWMYWLSGASFESVFAAHSTKANQGHDELETTGLCHFTFANEIFGSVNIDYLRPGSAPSHADDRIRLAGTKGVLEVREQKVYLIRAEKEGIIEVPQLAGKQIFSDFLQQVQGKKPCIVSAEDSFIVTEACLRARMSADEGRVIYF